MSDWNILRGKKNQVTEPHIFPHYSVNFERNQAGPSNQDSQLRFVILSSSQCTGLELGLCEPGFLGSSIFPLFLAKFELFWALKMTLEPSQVRVIFSFNTRFFNQKMMSKLRVVRVWLKNLGVELFRRFWLKKARNTRKNSCNWHSSQVRVPNLTFWPDSKFEYSHSPKKAMTDF